MHPVTAVLAALVAAALVRSQGSPSLGYRVYGELNSTDTVLVDANGTIVHTWPSAFTAGAAAYVLDNGDLLRSIRVGGPSIGGAGGGVQRVDFHGNVVWDFRYANASVWSHHDIIPMPNGNVMLTAWENKTLAEAEAMGRNPALLGGTAFLPDHLVEVQPTGPTSGTIVWEWHLWDHLIQDFDPAKPNYGVVANHPELVDLNYPPVVVSNGDWNHVNGIDYDPANEWVVVSSPTFNEIWIIDHATTTAEAQGHSGGRRGRGGDLLWRWGNPQAYRAGTTAEQRLFFQHDPRFVPPGFPGAGHVTVFDNQDPSGQSAVFELVLPASSTGDLVLGSNGRYGPAAPLWSYTAPGFYSPFVSSAQRLANGNTLICSGVQFELREVDPNGQVVWTYHAPGATSVLFHTHYVERSLWASTDSVSASNGGSIGLDLVSGSGTAASIYLVLGSVSGTQPGFGLGSLHVPLNPDFMLGYTAAYANTAPLLNQTIGLLDATGNGAAAIQLPPGLVPAGLVGLRMDFAYVVADLALQPLRASNAVPVRIVP